MEKKLNIDVAGSISEFEELMKEFMIRRVLYRIIFRGKGLDFDGYRDLNPDDDASDIDWKASSRGNKLLVRQYIEERDLKIMFVIDISENMLFGSSEKLKCEYAAEVALALAHLILISGDKIGFVLVNDKVSEILFPDKIKKPFDTLVDGLNNISEYGGIADLDSALKYLGDYLPNSINAVIVISDFLRIEKDFSKTLRDFSGRFETMAIMIKDPLDKTLPKIDGEVILEDPKTSEQIIIDPMIASKNYEKNALEQDKMVKSMFLSNDIDFVEMSTDKPFAFALAEFLKERLAKGKYIVPMR